MHKRVSTVAGIIILVIFAMATASVLFWFLNSHKMPAYVAVVPPVAQTVTNTNSNNPVDKIFVNAPYQLVAYNTEDNPCLAFQTLNQNGKVVQSDLLCNVMLDSNTFNITPSSVQDIQYANISWTTAGLFFDISLLKALPDSPMDTYHCQVVNFDKPTVSCNLKQQ